MDLSLHDLAISEAEEFQDGDAVGAIAPVRISILLENESCTTRQASIHSSRPKEVSQSEIKISINLFWLGLLVRPSIHFDINMSISMSIYDSSIAYLTDFKSDF